MKVHGDTPSAILRGKWFFLIGAAFFLFSACRDLYTGRTRPMYRAVTRSDDKYSYWFGIGQSVVVGICCLVVFVYLVQCEP